MLVGSDHEMQMAVGGLINVGDNIGQFDVGVLRAQRAAVDKQVLFVPAGAEGKEKTVTESLAVHAHAELR
jgi:hypothetical protein